MFQNSNAEESTDIDKRLANLEKVRADLEKENSKLIKDLKESVL